MCTQRWGRGTCAHRGEGGRGHVYTEVREGGTCEHRGEGGGNVHTEVREGDMCTQR